MSEATVISSPSVESDASILGDTDASTSSVQQGGREVNAFGKTVYHNQELVVTLEEQRKWNLSICEKLLEQRITEFMRQVNELNQQLNDSPANFHWEPVVARKTQTKIYVNVAKVKVFHSKKKSNDASQAF
jgi:hypothetical protein